MGRKAHVEKHIRHEHIIKHGRKQKHLGAHRWLKKNNLEATLVVDTPHLCNLQTHRTHKHNQSKNVGNRKEM